MIQSRKHSHTGAATCPHHGHLPLTCWAAGPLALSLYQQRFVGRLLEVKWPWFPTSSSPVFSSGGGRISSSPLGHSPQVQSPHRNPLGHRHHLLLLTLLHPLLPLLLLLHQRRLLRLPLRVLLVVLWGVLLQLLLVLLQHLRHLLLLPLLPVLPLGVCSLVMVKVSYLHLVLFVLVLAMSMKGCILH